MSFLTVAHTFTYLRHFLKVNEVAEAEWCQVQAGLLAVVGVFNGYCHFDVIGRPGSSVILPLPLPALARGRGRVIEAPSHRTDGSFHAGGERNMLRFIRIDGSCQKQNQRFRGKANPESKYKSQRDSSHNISELSLASFFRQRQKITFYFLKQRVC